MLSSLSFGFETVHAELFVIPKEQFFISKRLQGFLPFLLCFLKQFISYFEMNYFIHFCA